MFLKLITATLGFLVIGSLLSAIYLGWERSTERYKKQKGR